MKVLVTGANGFLASNIVRELIRREIQVRALVRPRADLRTLAGTIPELMAGDFTDPCVASEAMHGCEAVIHAAAETSQLYSFVEPYRKTNIEGTGTLLEAACNCNIKRFIFVSTANVFGFGSKENPGHEGLTSRYPFTGSGYAMSKVKAQELVLAYARTGRLNTVAVNPTFMIGPYDAKPSSGRIITMTVNRKLVPVPPGGKNFVDVRDVATGICNALEKGEPGSTYLMAGENLSYDEFYSKLEQVSGKAFIRLRFAPFIMEMLGTVGSLLSGVGLKISLNRTNAKILCVGNYYAGEKAIVELGMPHTPVEKSIADALDWFAQNGMVKY